MNFTTQIPLENCSMRPERMTNSGLPGNSVIPGIDGIRAVSAAQSSPTSATRRIACGFAVLFLMGTLLSGCFRYSFSGVAIPADVSTIYIPFFQDNSNSGLSDLPDQLNASLINRFVNQTRLRLVSSADQADIILTGTVTSYSNRPFTVAGDQTANLNRVTIGVRASYKFAREERARWDKSFSGQSEYDPTVDPLQGELTAVTEALDRIAQNMFSDSVGRW